MQTNDGQEVQGQPEKQPKVWQLKSGHVLMGELCDSFRADLESGRINPSNIESAGHYFDTVCNERSEDNFGLPDLAHWQLLGKVVGVATRLCDSLGEMKGVQNFLICQTELLDGPRTVEEVQASTRFETVVAGLLTEFAPKDAGWQVSTCKCGCGSVIVANAASRALVQGMRTGGALLDRLFSDMPGEATPAGMAMAGGQANSTGPRVMMISSPEEADQAIAQITAELRSHGASPETIEAATQSLSMIKSVMERRSTEVGAAEAGRLAAVSGSRQHFDD